VNGRTIGNASKDTGIETNKISEKPDVRVKKVDASGIMEGFDDDIEETGSYTPQKKPSSNDLPELIKKSKASNIPGFLKGKI
jgi:hypothetical protein